MGYTAEKRLDGFNFNATPNGLSLPENSLECWSRGVMRPKPNTPLLHHSNFSRPLLPQKFLHPRDEFRRLAHSFLDDFFQLLAGHRIEIELAACPDSARNSLSCIV